MPLRTRCALFLLLVPAVATAGDKVAATVNGEAITAAELDAAVGQLPPAEAPLSAAQKQQQRADVLQLLIDDRLVRQYLRQHGPKVDPAEVDRQFAALEGSLKKQDKTIDAYLKECGLTAAQAKENFLRMLQLARYTEAKATDAELRSYFEANRDFFDKTTVRDEPHRPAAAGRRRPRPSGKRRRRSCGPFGPTWRPSGSSSRPRPRPTRSARAPRTAGTSGTSSASSRRTSRTRRPPSRCRSAG